MKKTLIFLLLQGCALQLAMSRLDLTITSSTCGDYHDMEDIREAYVTYKGARLDKEDCNVRFMNYQTYAKQTCIKPLSINLGCSTKVEYHRHFISEYLEPAKRFSCGDNNYDAWCGPTRTNVLYILFRTSMQTSNDNIKLHVYLKDLPKEDDPWDDPWESQTSTSTVGVVIPVIASIFVVFFVVIIVIACKVAQNRRSRALPRTPYVYQPSGGPVTTQTAQGNMNQAQPMTSYQPPQQTQFQPAIQGGYQLHPMQSAYPAPAQQGNSPMTGYHPVGQTDTGRHSPASFHQPSAPPLNANADPPPSYDSITK